MKSGNEMIVNRKLVAHANHDVLFSFSHVVFNFRIDMVLNFLIIVNYV